MRFSRKSRVIFGAVCFVAALPLCAFQEPQRDFAKEARAALYSARYDQAVELYRQALTTDPSGDSYYGLTRALLRAHRSKESYAAALDALSHAAQTPGAQTAAGLAAFRRGELSGSEDYFRAAIKLDPKYPGALAGLAAIYNATSNARTARELLRLAFAASPDDPVLMLVHANTLKDAEHIAALERVLALIDPESEDARGLRAHIASDRALAGRQVRRLVSPYEAARIKLVPVMAGSSRLRGYGVRVQFNQRLTATLLLDTGASGISLSPKAAQKAGLELLTGESRETKGFGDSKPQDTLSYLASEVRMGNVVFADHTVSAFRSAKDSDVDGLLGADVFQRFLVKLDFAGLELALQPFPNTQGEDLQNAPKVPEGFHRVVRAGNHLLIATSVNGSPTRWFLIDSGSSGNLIDTESAHEVTGVREDALTGLRGVQGNVKKVSRADRVSLVFGGFRQENPNLIAISLEKQSDAMGIGMTGVLGMPVMTQVNLTIDYRTGAVRFERSR